MVNGISVIINTLNEENNIKNCLECVKWADEIIIVDMYSEDNTKKIASEYTNNIYMHKRMGFVEPARQFALDKVTKEWVLQVDADELVPRILKEQLLSIVNNNQFDAVLIPFKHYCSGHLLKGGRWNPTKYKGIPFFKKSYMKMSDEIHNSMQLNRNARVFKIKDINYAITHFSYINLDQYMEKLNRYSTIEAVQIQNQTKSGKSLLYRVCREIYFFLFKGGFKDGSLGLTLSVLDIAADFLTSIKIKLIKDNSFQAESVREKYQNIANGITDDYRK